MLLFWCGMLFLLFGSIYTSECFSTGFAFTRFHPVTWHDRHGHGHGHGHGREARCDARSSRQEKHDVEDLFEDDEFFPQFGGEDYEDAYAANPPPSSPTPSSYSSSSYSTRDSAESNRNARVTRSSRSARSRSTRAKEQAQTRTPPKTTGQATQTILNDLNDSQRAAVTAPTNDIIRVVAGPGAGKTRVLTSRIAWLLLQQQQQQNQQPLSSTSYSSPWPQEQILAVTFTNRAAAEMQTRLESLLHQAYNNNHNNNIPTSNDYKGATHMTTQRLLRRVTLGTFHSVCARLLRRHADVLSTLPSVAQLMPSPAALIPASTFAKVSNTDSETTTTTTTTTANQTPAVPLDASFAIVDQAQQLRIIRACMKTIGLHDDDDDNDDNDDDNNNNNNNKSQNFKPQQVLNTVTQLKNDAMLLASSSSPAAIQAGFTYTSTLTPTTTTNHNGAKPTKKKETQTSKLHQLATQILPHYLTTLRSTNSLDFNDLILLTRDLLLHHPPIRTELQQRYTHVLVDEFQDTSQAQLDLVKLLATDSLLVVGDGDQSIYSWRGANVKSMVDLEVDFRGVLKTFYLMENYRSTTNIVKAAQKVISSSPLETQRKKQQQEQKAKNGLVGTQCLSRQDMIPMRGKGPMPRVLACADSKTEANYVVQTIQKMITSNTFTTTTTTTTTHQDSTSIAILYRTNAQSRLLEEACVAHNLRYIIRGAAGAFYSRAEVKDCLSYLAILQNGRDKGALGRAMQRPKRGLGEKAVEEFWGYCDLVEKGWYGGEGGGDKWGVPPPSVLEVLLSLADCDLSTTKKQRTTTKDATSSKEESHKDGSNTLNPLAVRMADLPPPETTISTRTRNRLVPFAKIMRDLQQQAQCKTVSELLEHVLEVVDMRQHVESLSKNNDEFEDRWQNVMELQDACERYSKENVPALGFARQNEKVQKNRNKKEEQEEEDQEEDGEALSPLGQFLSDVVLLSSADDAGNDNDQSPHQQRSQQPSANLMTIHASKGMEFDAVFLVGNEEGTFPTQRAVAAGERSVLLEEERRLCYVAMTRARTHLFLTWRKELLSFGLTSAGKRKTMVGKRSRFLEALVSSKSKKKKKKKDEGERKEEKKAVPKRLGATQSQARPASAFTRKTPVRRIPRQNGNVSSPRIAAQAVQRRARAVSSPRQQKTMKNYSNKKSNVSSSLDMDSTMFFPVGSRVMHSVHGPGAVVPSSKKNENHGGPSVQVEFDESGLVLTFPVMNSGLQMVY